MKNGEHDYKFYALLQSPYNNVVMVHVSVERKSLVFRPTIQFSAPICNVIYIILSYFTAYDSLKLYTVCNERIESPDFCLHLFFCLFLQFNYN